jgi:hypothetical protein
MIDLKVSVTPSIRTQERHRMTVGAFIFAIGISIISMWSCSQVALMTKSQGRAGSSLRNKHDRAF